MTSGATIDTIVQAARGEPMSVFQQRRLEDELQRNPVARGELEAQRTLSSRFHELRQVIQSMEAPDAAALILAAAESAPDVRPRPMAIRRVSYAAAAGFATVLATLVLGPLLLDFDEPDRRGEGSTIDIDPILDSTDYFNEFLPLRYDMGLSSMETFSIVRVRIPASSVNFVDARSDDGWSIEADVILGEDGLARGIRFAETEIWPAQD